MAAILIHERRRMQEIEQESIEIRNIRRNIETAHFYITGLVMSGESVISWEKADYLQYNTQRLQTDSLLQLLKPHCTDFVHPAQIDTLRILLADKEEHLRHIMLVFERQEETDSLLVNQPARSSETCNPCTHRTTKEKRHRRLLRRQKDRAGVTVSQRTTRVQRQPDYLATETDGRNGRIRRQPPCPQPDIKRPIGWADNRT